jgi:hypothetical protein
VSKNFFLPQHHKPFLFGDLLTGTTPVPEIEGATLTFKRKAGQVTKDV